MNKDVVFKFYDHVYGIEYTIIIAEIDVLIDFMRKNVSEEEADGLEEQNIEKGIGPKGLTIYANGSIIIWLESLNGSVQDLGCLAHECLHAMARIMEFKDIPLCEGTHEAYAYYMDFLFGSILENYREIKRRENAKKNKRPKK